MQNLISLPSLSWFSPARIQDIYLQFLANFPIQFQPMVSVAVGLIIVFVVYRIIKRDFIFIIALVILVPTSIPVLKSVWGGIVSLLKYLFNIH
jgi:hypothetical protein